MPVKYEGAIPALSTIEMPMVSVLVSMEQRGICLSKRVLGQQKPAMLRKLLQLEAQAAAANGGEKFNLAAPGEVGKVLFQKLALVPPPSAKMLKSGLASTNAEVLEDLLDQHPLPSIILEHRKINKIVSSFLEPLADLANKQPADEHGLVRIHGQFMQTNTSTGRLAMEEPSLQTIPRPLEYELAATQDPLGSASAPSSLPAAAATAGPGTSGGASGSGGAMQEINIRAAFVAPPGWVLLGADYKQLELRLMAHLSADQKLLDALGAHGADPFVELAVKWLKKERSEVTSALRDQAKRLAYGVLYGMGPQALAKELNMSAMDAFEMQQSFFREFSGVTNWREAVVDNCRRTGSVKTAAGRKRELPSINDSSSDSRSRAERQAINTVCQGSAADIVKGVMVSLQEQLASTGLVQHCHMLLQVHDELLFEVEASCLDTAAALVRSVMEDAAAVWGLRVSLPVKVSVGPDWGHLQEYAEVA